MKKVLGVACGVVVVILFGAGAWLWLNRQEPVPAPAPVAQQPAKKPAPLPPSYTDTILSKMSLQDKLTSLIMIHTPGVDPGALGGYMTANRAGGFIMMGDNIPGTDDQLKSITAMLRGEDRKVPRLIGIDQEGGTVRRLMGDNYASALTLKNQPVEATAQAFAARSAMVQSVGVTLNFGIIADTTANPASFIYERVLGTTPQAAAERVTAAVTASKGKTLSTLKHFPGHGETVADSHTSIPTTDISYEQWQSRDKPPFQAGVAAGADVVMTGHLRYTSVDGMPASLSKKWHDILRNDVSFKGVVITDAMGMLQNSGDPAYADPVQNAIMALQAGNDMLLYVAPADTSGLISGVMAAVADGRIREAAIDESAKRVLELRSKSSSLVIN